MSERRSLKLTSEDQVVSEVERLRKGYRKTKNWSLPQMCWHMQKLIDDFLKPPANPGTPPTPQQAAMKKGFVDLVLETNAPPTGDAPASFVPPPSATEGDVDRFVAGTKKLKAYDQPFIDMGPFGPVAIGEARRLFLIHASHHLSHLVPNDPPQAGS